MAGAMGGSVAGPPAHVAKIEAFRNFASSLQGQVVEQLCQEFEREVSIMWNDLLQYRHELQRVAELLGQQLTRERQLHEMLDAMAGHHAQFANSATMAAQQTPDAAALHDLVEQFFGQHSQVMNTTLQGVSQARQIAETHAASAKQLQEPLITAENEYNRIMSMLSVPVVPGQAPRPTVARGEDGVTRVSTPVVRDITPPMTPARPVTVAPGRQCQNCGNTYMDDSLYCRKCGIRRQGVAATALPPHPQQASYAGPPMVLSASTGAMGPVMVQGPPGQTIVAGPPVGPMVMQGPASAVRLF
eukprot:TRINITY_DN121341_c0_g1_i1.p1 TRINITY_DN121341_c0_g1~~TRINITY_DN121341_c0_g1_i1.p1  ORF type:complete len:323 (+),score=60.15 TRINITY_DN121341_c0_g1_i1:67-969(+)